MPNETVAGLLISIDGNTVKLRSEFDKAKAAARSTAREMKSEFAEAKAGIKQVGEEIGFGLNRHLTSFLAKLPGVAPLMAAAFPVAAVVGITTAVVEFGSKIAETVKKVTESASVISEGFEKIHDKTSMANDELAVTNDKLEEQIAKITGKHPNTLRTELDEAALAADRLVKSLQADNKEVAELLDKNQTGLLGQFFGMASTKEITGKVIDIQHSLDEAARTQREHAHEYAEELKKVGDAEADRGRREEIRAKAKAQFDKDETARLKVLKDGAATMAAAYNESHARTKTPGAPGQIGNETAIQTIAGSYGHHLEDLLASADEMSRNQADTSGLKQAKDNADAEKERLKDHGETVMGMLKWDEFRASENQRILDALSQTGSQQMAQQQRWQHQTDAEEEAARQRRMQAARDELAQKLESARYDRDSAKERFQGVVADTEQGVRSGDLSPRKRVEILQAALDEQHDAVRKSFDDELALFDEGTREYTRVLDERKKADIAYYAELAALQRESAQSGFGAAFDDIMRRANDFQGQFREMVNGSLGSINNSILQTMTDKYHQGQWKEAGKSIFSGVAGMGLQDAEGHLAKAIGIGMGKLGSKGNPMYTRSADPLPSFGGSTSAGEGSSGGGALGAIFGIMQFAGFMAEGGTMSAGGYYLTGEEGPELIQVGSTSRINNARDTSRMLSKSSGDTHHQWNIDARGASDPAAVRRQVEEGIAAATPRIVAATMGVQRDLDRRRPNIRL